MPPEQALTRLSQALTNNPTISVVVASEPNPEAGVVIQRLNIGENLAAEFVETVQRGVPAVNADLSLRPYDPGYRPDPHELVYIRLAENPEIAGQIRQISQVQQAELFHEDDRIVDHLRFYAVVAGATARHRGVFFRTYNPKKELTRRSGFAALLDRGSYNKVDTKIFLFDYGVDCFAWDDYLFIRNVGSFQRIFKYFDELRKRAIETVNMVSGRIPISNLADFRAACSGHVHMMSKLAQIAGKPYLNSVTMRDIKQTIDDFGLAVEVVRDHGQEKLLFEPGLKKRWLILKLLDDDFLGSTMTKAKYEVNSKSAL